MSRGPSYAAPTASPAVRGDGSQHPSMPPAAHRAGRTVWSVVPAARWLTVLAVAVGLVGVPALTRAWPVEQSDVTAADLAGAVLEAPVIGWSGEVRTQGSVDVPVSDSQLDGVARLLGESSTLRVWWRSPEEHRVDRVRPSGETDLVRSGGFSVRWRYEGNRVGIGRLSPLRLPDDPDVLPVSLAAQLLDGAEDDELARLPDERIAGRAAAGLRLTPADARSAIDRVDLWADQQTGLPLRIEVYAAGEPTPALTSEVTDLDLRRPTSRQVWLDLSPGVEVSRERGLGDAGRGSGAIQGLPRTLAGLERAGGELDLGSFGGSGGYGRGTTALTAIPVRDSVARDLRSELRRAAELSGDLSGTAVGLGPFTVGLATAPADGGDVAGQSYLLVGTLGPAAVQRAGDELGRVR